jgi:hypothetical protein
MELEQLMEDSVKLIEEDFYKKKFYFSYSSLNKLMWNPTVFYQMYVLGLKEEKTDQHLVHGKVIHALLLEKEKFNEKFTISLTSLPTGNTKTVLDIVYKHSLELIKNGDQRTELNEYQNAIIDVLRDMNLHQSLKTDQQRVDKIITPEALTYWSYLQTKGEKTVIDKETYDYCENAVEMIKFNKDICGLIGCNVSEFDNKQVFNEIPLQVDIPNNVFGLKGIIDNLVFDHDKKIVYINDIKTTSKDLKDFSETVEFYSYWMQAAIYCTLISLKHPNLLASGYQLKFHFVVIDKMLQAYAFPVREATLVDWLDRFKAVLDKAMWHYEKRRYDLPYDFAVNSVTL